MYCLTPRWSATISGKDLKVHGATGVPLVLKRVVLVGMIVFIGM